MKKILAVRNDRFGEFILNIPVFRAIKESYPESKLTVITSSAAKELAGCIDYIDEIIVWDNIKHPLIEILAFSKRLKKSKFDACIILNPTKEFHLISFLASIPKRIGYGHKAPFFLTKRLEDLKYLGIKHEIDYNLELAELLGAKTQNKSLELNIPPLKNQELLAELKLEDARPIVVVHPWTSDPVKQWPIENFIVLIKNLVEQLHLRIVIIGGKEEAEKSKLFFKPLLNASAIDFTGRTTLPEVAGLLKLSQLLITLDSGPMHLSCAVNKPVVALFRNDLPGKTANRWGPWGKNNTVIEKPSLKDISVSEVVNAAKRSLNQ